MELTQNSRVKPMTMILWPWVFVAESWVLRTVSLRRTFERSIMELVQTIWGIWNGHELKGQSHDLELWPWPWVCVANSLVLHIISLRGIFGWSLMKIAGRVQEIWSRHEIQVKSFNIDLWPWLWVYLAASCTLHTILLLTKRNIWVKVLWNSFKGFRRYVAEEIWSGQEIQG